MQITQRSRPACGSTQAEEAAAFYVSVFKNSKITSVAATPGRPGDPQAPAGVGDDRRVRARRAAVHRAERRPGLQVQRGGLAAGPLQHQEEVDYYWEKLEGRRPQGAAVRLAEGQVRPVVAGRAHHPAEMLKDHESATAQRAMEAMLRMKKIDIAELERAVAGDRSPSDRGRRGRDNQPWSSGESRWP